jgi:hypothetical protein
VDLIFLYLFGDMKTKILVCCHKNDIFKSSDVYLPIQVGRAISNTTLNMQGDIEVINLSEKNGSYCELTGMYWAWKNLKDVDYIGLCHYRRYFDFNHIGRKVFPSTTLGTRLFDSLNLEINSDIESYLERGACVVAKSVHLHTSLYLQYCEGHYSPDFKVMGDVIRETLSPEYFQGFWKYLVESNKFSPYNMFIMSWKQFDDYCSWLFPLLGAVEDKLDISHYPPFQKRVYGYLAERLLNLYVRTNKLKRLELPIIKIADEPEVDNISWARYYIRSLVRDLAINATGNSR